MQLSNGLLFCGLNKPPSSAGRLDIGFSILTTLRGRATNRTGLFAEEFGQ